MDRMVSGGQVRAIRIRRPSNFHAHFRQGPLMQAVAPHILRHVKYALAMPNTGPVRTIEDMRRYRDDLMRIVENDPSLAHVSDIVMTVYLTDFTTPKMIEQIARFPFPCAVKYYPPHKGATTGSGEGIPLSEAVTTLRAMEMNGVRLLGHFESVTDQNNREIPPALREGYMVDHELWRFREKYPLLNISFEHASTAKAVDFVKADPSGRTVMTVTPQHSLFTHANFEDDTLGAHLKCMPIVKTAEDRAAILAFIVSGDPRAIAGDDTAPHVARTKDVAFSDAMNGCWLPHSIALYAHAFDQVNALSKQFENFMSMNGPRWWHLDLPDPGDTILIERVTSDGVPEPVPVPELNDQVIPLGWTLQKRFPVGWRVAA